MILSTTTRIWGVMYDAVRDLIRVPLCRESVAERVEALTYAITRVGDVSRLELAWDDQRLSGVAEPAGPAPTGTIPCPS